MAELRSYNPSWRERMAIALSKLTAGPGGETRESADMGHRLTGAIESVVPGVGVGTFGNDAVRAGQRGDYLAAGGNALLAGASALPFVGAGRGALMGRNPYDPIPGTPSKVKLPGGEEIDAKPIPGIVDAARDYAKSRGMPHATPQAFEKVDPERASRIGKWYGDTPDATNDPKTKAAYEQLAEETLGQYRALKDRGYEFSFMKRGDDGNVIDPYAESPALGYKDLSEKNRLEVFPTDAGFGTENAADAGNALLKDSGEFFGDQPATYNDLFRAVHDAYGHFGHGNAFFRAPGEERAWQLHSQMYSPEARPAMTSETRGQNSWLNYGPHADHNATAKGADTKFADQKNLAAPDWVVNEGIAPAHTTPYIPSPELRLRPNVAPFTSTEER